MFLGVDREDRETEAEMGGLGYHTRKGAEVSLKQPVPDKDYYTDAEHRHCIRHRVTRDDWIRRKSGSVGHTSSEQILRFSWCSGLRRQNCTNVCLGNDMVHTVPGFWSKDLVLGNYCTAESA